MEQNKQMTIELLKKITKLDIVDLEFKRFKTMENIEEYRFSIIKLNAILKNGKSQETYIKLVRKNRIKESIFCYWCLLYDEKFKQDHKNEYISITNNVKIIERRNEEFKHTVSLKIEKNNWGMLEYGSDIHLVKFRKFLSQETENTEIQRWKKYIPNNSDDVLFIGIVNEEKNV